MKWKGLFTRGIADGWYRYRDAALAEIASEFLVAQGIEFRRETSP